MDLRRANIADRTQDCLEDFQALIRALGSRTLSQGDELSLLAIEDQIGRFRLWAGNIGALQEGRSSLDYRLRDAKYVLGNVHRLLDSLYASLIGATRAASRPAESKKSTESEIGDIPCDYETSSESSAGSNLNAPIQSELAGYYLTIVEIIGRLFKLSIAIRNSSVQNAIARSTSFVEKDEAGNDLFILFEKYVLSRITHHYPDLSLVIAERISKAVGRRRRQFGYQRRHREKLGKNISTARTPAETIKIDNTQSSSSQEVAAPAPGLLLASRLEPSIFHHSILSETTATQYVPRPEQPQTPSTKSFSAASGFSKSSDIDIPPPILPDEEREFECPYCFFILSGKLKEQRAWRKHVFDDLSPYLCLFDDCPHPDQTFSSYNEWVYHEDWSHNLQWCCDLTSHDLQLFDSQAELETHLREQHNEDIEDTGIVQLMTRNQRPAPILWTECPFCKFVPDLSDVHEISAGLSQEELASKKLVKHIGHHLQSISTLALPWRDDLKDDAGSELDESAKIRDLETGSELDGLTIDDTIKNDDADLGVYDFDLRSVASTDNQRWDIDLSSLHGPDGDDPIIHHLFSHQAGELGRLEQQFVRLWVGEFRVLQLQPGAPDEMIHCDQLISDLKNIPAYSFLSYVWGDRSDLESIIVNGKICRVTRNLYDALRAIRSQSSASMFWIDALCINIDDDRERSSQLALMPQIAQHASGTMVWLGCGSNDSDMAMSFVGNYSSFELGGANSESGGVEIGELRRVNAALKSLFARPWWSRAWVVQEVLLSDSVTVRCGSSSTNFENFVGLRHFILPPRSLYQPLARLIAEMPFGDILWSWDQLRAEISKGTATLFSIMIAMRDLQSTDPRDKVYAALGLSREAQKSLMPDYTKSVQEVYGETMRYIISTEKNVWPLYLVEEHQPVNIADLPSWVIDWSVRPIMRTGFGFDGRQARGAYQSDIWLPRYKMELSEEEHVLRLHGMRLTVVEDVGELFPPSEADDTTMFSCCRNWWTRYKNSEGGSPLGREAFCRTFIANRRENFAEEPTLAFITELVSWLEQIQGGPLFKLLLNSAKSHLEGEFEALIRRSCSSRRFAVAHNNHPALVPERAQIGDTICFLLGGAVPFVLRQAEGGWLLIGEAYVHGFMDGEISSQLSKGLGEIESFLMK